MSAGPTGSDGPLVRIVETNDELTACFAIRRRVFIEEQNVPEDEEMDELDAVCTHFLALPAAAGALMDAVGTARLWIRPDGTAKAQRVAVLADSRGQGVGRALMRAVEHEAARLGCPELILGAQLTAIPFYERLGYEAYGGVFDDAGIPHRMMRRTLPEERGARPDD